MGYHPIVRALVRVSADVAVLEDVVLVAGAPFASNLLMLEDGSAWPNAPRLTFSGGFYLASVLSSGGTVASFDAPPSGAMDAVADGADVALHDPVTGRVWGTGKAKRRTGVPT